MEAYSRCLRGRWPYPIFANAALLPWNYFSQSLTRSSTSLVGNAHLITKVYFSRLVIPVSVALSGLVDFGIAFLVLGGLMICFGVVPTAAVALLLTFLFLAMLTALGFGLWLSALNVRYRDINYLVPFLVQVWMYVTPVIYGSTLIPEHFRFLLGLNPMTGVVEGFRWALLGSQPLGELFAISIAIALAMLISGGDLFPAHRTYFCRHHLVTGRIPLNRGGIRT